MLILVGQLILPFLRKYRVTERLLQQKQCQSVLHIYPATPILV